MSDDPSFDPRHHLANILTETKDIVADTYKLPPASAKLLALLLLMDTVTPDMAVKNLQVTTDLAVAIHRLRKLLNVWADERSVDRIKILQRRGIGYWMRDETKERVRHVEIT